MAKRLAVIAVMIAMLFIPMLAKADSVWTYQGNALSAPGFLSGDGALTGTVLLNSNDQVEAWSFSAPNGPVPLVLSNFNTINATFNLFNCTSCSGTPFKGWSISMFVPPPPFSGLAGVDMSSFWNPDTGVGLDYVNNHNGGFGQVNVTDNPGVWTEVVSTPEPGSLLLLGAGITALALAISLQKTLA
jgi:PEP-CTERM motif